MIFSKKILTGSVLSILVLSSCATTNEAPDIKISNCAIKESIPGSSSTGAYFIINNTKTKNISLIKASVPEDITNHVEIHRMTTKNGIMQMEEIPNYRLRYGKNTFELGSYHVMLLDVKNRLQANEVHPLTLYFDDGTERTCDAKVLPAKKLKPKAKKRRHTRIKEIPMPRH